MEAIDLEQLELALVELTIRIQEAKGLNYNGRSIQCDRKLQGALVKLGSICQYVADVKGEGNNEVVTKTNEEG